MSRFENPLIWQHAGIYIKEDPVSETYIEVFELRPDLLVAWTAIATREDNFLEDLELRGHWGIREDRLWLMLTDENGLDMITLFYYLKNGKWMSERTPGLALRKRSGVESLQGPFYFDDY